MKAYEKYFKSLATITETLGRGQNNFHRLMGVCFERFPDSPKDRDFELNRLTKEEAGQLKLRLEQALESLSTINFD